MKHYKNIMAVLAGLLIIPTTANVETLIGGQKVADYAGLYTYDASIEVAIALTDAYEKLTTFTADMAEKTSNGAHSTDNITIGASGVYEITYTMDMKSAAGGKTFAFNAFEIAASAAGTSIAGISKATPGVVTTSANHGLSNGDKVKIAGVVGMVEVNDNIYTIANKTDKTFELTDDEGVDINTSGYTDWSSGGAVYLTTSLDCSHTHSGFSNQDIARTAAASCFAPLTAGNTLEIYVKGITDDTNITMVSGQLAIKRVE